MPLLEGYPRKKARSAIKDYTAPYKKDEDQEPELYMSDSEDEDEGTDEPADIVGLAKEEKKEQEKSSGWGKKVAAAIAGTIGAVAGANLQHKQNERKRKIYEAKRKTGNYL